MLDVYPPQHTPHTWRDFFIHIATIVVGLIIAIGLEQTVEFVHHTNERHSLITEMHAEAERNIELIHTDIDRNLDKADWYSAVMAAIRDARPQNGIVTVTLPPHVDFAPQIYPSRAVWPVAKTNGKAALLSESQAEVYDRLDSEANNEIASDQRAAAASTRLESEEIRLGIHLQPGATVQLPASEVPLLTQDIAEIVAAAHDNALQCAFWLGAEHAVANNVHDREEFIPYLRQQRLELQRRLAQQGSLPKQ